MNPVPRAHRPRAFVSSTFVDLQKHRAVVIEQLRKAGIFVDPMEDWTADGDEPKGFFATRVEDCDLCVLLVTFRRAMCPTARHSRLPTSPNRQYRGWDIAQPPPPILIRFAELNEHIWTKLPRTPTANGWSP